MAEPARQQGPVYDNDQSGQPVTKPDLKALEGGGETSQPRRGHLSSVPDSSGPGGGLYNPGGDTGGGDSEDKAASPAKLRDNEESAGDDDDRVGSGYTPDRSKPGGKVRSKFRMTRRKALFSVGASSLFAMVFGFLSISSGPLQLIHLDEILKKEFSGTNDISSIRLNSLYRYYKTGNVGETRVGLLGSKVVGNSLDQLSKIGIEFQRDSLDHIKSATIDTAKLSQRYPELKNMNDLERRAFLSDTFGLSEDHFVKIGAGSDVTGTKFAVNTRDFGIKATRALVKGSLFSLEDGSVVSGIRFRVLAKFFKLPSLFHPMDRASAAAEKKLTTKVERDKAEEERQKALEKPAADDVAPAEDSIKSKINGENLAAGALLLTTGMCIVRSVADDVVAVNRGAIVVPSSIQAVDKTASGEQIKSGQGFTAAQPGGIVDGFTDSNGKTIWNGQALQALAGSPQTGTDLPFEYKQAFSNDTTAQHIKDAIGSVKIGGVDISGAACSTPGLIIQGIAGLALAAGSILAAIPSGGASIAAEVAKAGAGAAATAGAIYLLQQEGANLLSDKAILPTVFGGPLGGNLLAYGAREGGNIGCRSAGCIPLDNTTATMLDKQQQQEDQQKFRSESFFARTFNPTDYRSLSGRLADSLSPSIPQNVASLSSDFLSIGSSLPHLLGSIFTPSALADAQPYHWGFAKDGIPPVIANDPNLQDPYANADFMAGILDSNAGQGYIDRAKSCFGSTVSKGPDGWDATPVEAVNPNSEDYINAHCGDISDYNWRRMILFVFDTGNMKSVACFNGDDQACQDLGYDNGAGSSGSGGGSTGPVVTGSAQQLAQQILNNHNIDLSCLSSSVAQDIQDAANGQPGTAGAPISAAILQLIATVGQSHHVCITAIESNGAGHTAGSYHYTGDAVDFGSLDGVAITGRNPPALTVIQTAFTVLPAGSGLGQVNCGNTPPLPAGWIPSFFDYCTHLHVEVARGTP